MKNNDAPAASRGRPREFDAREALAAALRVFWLRGYEGASLNELTEAMGIARPSLYACFGNKEALFRKALDLYEEEKLAYVNAALAAPTARGVAYRLLTGALDLQVGTEDPKGCLGVTSSVGCGEKAQSIKAEVVARWASSEAELIRRFERARCENDLPDHLQPAALARYLNTFIKGLCVQASAGATRDELQDLGDTMMTLWPSQ